MIIRSPTPNSQDPEWQFKQQQDIARAINGGVEFGGPSNISSQNPNGIVNINGSWLDTTTPGANVEFTFTHKLGRIPVGVIVVSVDKAAIIYASRRNQWTSKEMYLKCDQATTHLVCFAI